MTTLTTPRPSTSPDLRQRRSIRRAIQTTWIQHRAALLSFAFIFAVIVTAIVVCQIYTHGSYASYVNHGCVARPINHVPCGDLDNALQNMNDVFTGLLIVLGVLPMLVGAFVGAPLLSNEFESGTFRFTWTQGTGRTRYFLTKFGVLALFFTIVTFVIGILFGNWYAHPFEVTGADSHWQGGLFDTTGWMLAAWSLFALACGSFLGVITKRTVSAIATTAFVVSALLGAAYEVLPRLLKLWTLSSSKILAIGLNYGSLNGGQLEAGLNGRWVVGGYLTGPKGQVLNRASANNIFDRALSSNGGSVGAARWLSNHHYTLWTTYQPSSHFWVFQSVEVVVVLGLAALFIWGTVRRIGRS
jgi:uncharacterized membrane protein YidH (DUF202 family)